MINDPYKTLGISRNASKDEIRKAYRKKAKEYHPDLHPDDPDAHRKMNEVNEAYDMLMNPSKYSSASNHQQAHSQNNRNTAQQQRTNNYQGPGGWASDFGGFDFEDIFGFGFSEADNANMNPQPQLGDSMEIRHVITAINRKSYQEALNILFHIPSTGRNARWYYLNGLANHYLGNTVQAADHIQKAIQLDPGNQTYQKLLRRFRQSSSTYTANTQEYNKHSVNANKLCIGLAAAPICCSPYGVPICL